MISFFTLYNTRKQWKKCPWQVPRIYGDVLKCHIICPTNSLKPPNIQLYSHISFNYYKVAQGIQFYENNSKLIQLLSICIDWFQLIERLLKVQADSQNDLQ